MSQEPIRILLVEDDEDEAYLLQRALTKTAPGLFAISRVGTLDAARRALGSSPFDVVLLDLSLPDSRGFDTFVRMHEADPEVAFVVLTGNDDERLAVRALNEGAQDYLIKGKAEGHVLVRSMRYAIERNRSRRLQADNTALENEIRARPLAKEQLEGVAAQLEASNRELQQFASMASHDLEEPLRKIAVFQDRGLWRTSASEIRRPARRAGWRLHHPDIERTMEAKVSGGRRSPKGFSARGRRER